MVGVALLSGCALLDQIFGGITGGGSGGGTASSAYPISGRMKFSLAATVWRDDGYTGKHTYAGNLATTFWSGAGEYHEDSRKFYAYNWDDGEDFWNTYFNATLSADGKTITSFSAYQTQANVWGGYMYTHVIDGVNVPFSHVDGNSRYYQIEGTAVRALVTDLKFTMSAGADTSEWTEGGATAATGDSGDYIEIRLDYQNAAVAP